MMGEGAPHGASSEGPGGAAGEGASGAASSGARGAASGASSSPSLAPSLAPSIDELRRLAAEHLGAPLWLAPEHLAWLRDPSVEPAPVRSCFADALYKATVEPLAHRFASRLVLRCEGEVCHRVVARLAPELPSATITMLLTEEAELLFCAQTDAARRKDGIIQLQDGQAGVTALTPAALRAQAGKALLKGDLIVSIAVERS